MSSPWSYSDPEPKEGDDGGNEAGGEGRSEASEKRPALPRPGIRFTRQQLGATIGAVLTLAAVVWGVSYQETQELRRAAKESAWVPESLQVARAYDTLPATARSAADRAQMRIVTALRANGDGVPNLEDRIVAVQSDSLALASWKDRAPKWEPAHDFINRLLAEASDEAKAWVECQKRCGPQLARLSRADAWNYARHLAAYRSRTQQVLAGWERARRRFAQDQAAIQENRKQLAHAVLVLLSVAGVVALVLAQQEYRDYRFAHLPTGTRETITIEGLARDEARRRQWGTLIGRAKLSLRTSVILVAQVTGRVIAIVATGPVGILISVAFPLVFLLFRHGMLTSGAAIGICIAWAVYYGLQLVVIGYDRGREREEFQYDLARANGALAAVLETVHGNLRRSKTHILPEADAHYLCQKLLGRMHDYTSLLLDPKGRIHVRVSLAVRDIRKGDKAPLQVWCYYDETTNSFERNWSVLADDSVAASAVRSKAVQYIEDVRLEASATVRGDEPFRSIVCIPICGIKAPDSVIGVISLDAAAPRFFRKRVMERIMPTYFPAAQTTALILQSIDPNEEFFFGH
jgi:hypothetical protein